MFAIIESTIIKQKGFISLFKTFKFKIIIRDEASLEYFLEEISLKSKTGFVGYICEIPRTTKKLLIELVYEDQVENYLFNVKEGKETIKIDISKFKGVINIKFTNKNMFLELENMERLKKGLKNLNEVSKQIALNKEKMSTRITYENKIYYVDLQNNKCFWEKENKCFNFEMPKGWERRFTTGNKLYYINHNKNITQWENPDSKSYIVELENKILEYKKFSEEADFYIFFEVSKFRIITDRRYIVQSTAFQLINAKREELKRQPIAIFIGEIGEDYGAILKEFFYECSLEIIKDERIKHIAGVFDVKSKNERNLDIENKNEMEIHLNASDITCEDQSPHGSTLISEPNMMEAFFNINARNNTQTREGLLIYSGNQNTKEDVDKESEVHKNKLSDKDFFTYLGVFIGLAIEHEINIGIDFSLAFYENLLKRKFVIFQVQDVQTQSSLNYILKNSINDDILFDNDNNPVNDENKIEYVHKTIVNLLYESKKQEYDWIREGFYKIAVQQIADIFTAFDLSKLLCGRDELTFDMIKNSVVYFNCSDEMLEVQFLWNILKKKNEDFYRKFIQFLTGSASVPLGGLKNQKFKWFLEITNDEKKLVRASACLNKLYIGQYENEEQMEYFLTFSIENTEGFHKV